MGIIIIILITILLVLWILLVHRRLSALDEAIAISLQQLREELSACFEALTVLLELTEDYAPYVSEALSDSIHSVQDDPAALQSHKNILRQEKLMTETLDYICIVSEHIPGVKSDKRYIQCMESFTIHEEALYVSQQAYNMQIKEMNHKIHQFPVSLLAGPLGFRQEKHLKLWRGNT